MGKKVAFIIANSKYGKKSGFPSLTGVPMDKKRISLLLQNDFEVKLVNIIQNKTGKSTTGPSSGLV